MKIFLRISLFLILPFCSLLISTSLLAQAPGTGGITLSGPWQQEMQVILLVPADSMVNGHAVLRVMPDDNPVGKVVYNLFRESYMRDAVVFYFLAQNFMVNSGQRKQAEPAYLLLSQNQGGFPRYGFYLQEGDSLTDKTDVPYIELVKNDTVNESQLGSMTQIYPHEMGHVLYHLLSKDTDTVIPASVDIHYATLTTDYRTAFNEGFAMHFENMARLYEPDEKRKAAIIADFEDRKGKSGRKIAGYKRDFTWPFRPGFYRMAMVTWFQALEDIKRFEWVNDYRMKYENESIVFSDPEKTLFYRNSGIRQDSLLRIPQRAFATEGVIASFFAGLMQSDTKNKYCDAGFYHSFLPPGDSTGEVDIKSITPIENQYMKVFRVLHDHVNETTTIRSQFMDFVDAYIRSYPEEKALIESLFNRATGLVYPPDTGRELWLINPDHEHGVLVMEQFGGITVPFYTFNLNAATGADLLTFDAISTDEAGLITGYIRENGPLQALDSLDRIPGLSEPAKAQLKNNPFDPQFFEDLEDVDIKLTINSLVLSYIRQLLIMALLYGLLALALVLPLHYRMTGRIKIMAVPGLFLRFLLLMVVALAAVVATPYPVLYFAGATVMLLVPALFVMRSKERRNRLIITTLPMVALLIYTII